MAVGNQAIFIQSVHQASVSVAAANTARDGSGSINTVCTVSADGAKIISFRSWSSQASAAANSAMVVCWYYSVDSGTTWRKLTEYGMSAVTAANDTPASFGGEVFDDMLVPNGAVIGVTQTLYAGVQDKMHHSVIYGNYTA